MVFKKVIGTDLFVWMFLNLFSVMSYSQDNKPKSYIISNQETYSIDVAGEKPSVVLYSEEKKWVGDKDDNQVLYNRIDYDDSFETVSDIEAYSVSSDRKVSRVYNIYTESQQIENIFVHDSKFKYFYFQNLKEGSETFTSYKKKYKEAQLVSPFYFNNNLESKISKLTLKVSENVEIGYVVLGENQDKIKFESSKEGKYFVLTWQMTDCEKIERSESSPGYSYYLPHIVFYVKSYKNKTGSHAMLGTVENLFNYYCQTISGINSTDQSVIKEKTLELTNNLTTNSEKVKAVFDFVQSKIQYVAFEDGMGGYIPRDAAEIFQKKYGDCKDMANLINEMLHYAGIESHLAWIGTRNRCYSYKTVPTPIADNHMIAVAKISEKELFLDATGKYTVFPDYTPFIQEKEALIKLNDKEFEIVKVPIVPGEKNKTSGLIKLKLENDRLIGDSKFNWSGFSKSKYTGIIKNALERDKPLKEYFAGYIQNINIKDLVIKNDDLSQNPLEVTNSFEIEKWIKKIDRQIMMKPILFFPFHDSKINIEERKIPIEFGYLQSFAFDYEIEIPDGYKLEYKPENFNFSNELLNSSITYELKNNKLMVSQKLETHKLLLEKQDFQNWNLAIKNITRQYNQNIILTQ